MTDDHAAGACFWPFLSRAPVMNDWFALLRRLRSAVRIPLPERERLRWLQGGRLAWLLVVLFAMFFGLSFTWVSLHAEREEMARNLSLLAELSGKSVDAFFQQIDGRLAVLADSHNNTGETPARLQLRLARFMRFNPQVVRMVAIDAQGNLLAAAVQGASDASGNEALVQFARTSQREILSGKRMLIGHARYDVAARLWVIPALYGVRDPDGQVRRLFVFSMRAEQLQDLWQSMYLPTQAQMGLLLDGGYLLSIYPAPTAANSERIYEQPRSGVLAQALQRPTFARHGTIEGYNSVARKAYYFAWYHLDRYPLTFFVAIPVTNLYHRWWSHNQFFYWLGILFLLAGAAVYQLMASRTRGWERERARQSARLETQRRWNQRIIDASPIGIAIYEQSGNCIVVNPAMEHLFGDDWGGGPARRQSHRLQDWEEFGAGTLIAQAQTQVESSAVSGMLAFRRTDGTLVNLNIMVSMLEDEGERHLLLMATDLSETLRVQQALQESELKLHRVIAVAPLPIMIHAEDGEVLEINHAWQQVSGYSFEDIPTVGRWLDLAYGEGASIVRERVNMLYASEQRVDQGELLIRCKNGELCIWHIVAIQVGHLADGRRYAISTAQDVTERRAAQDRVEFLAYHDALTGLPNRILVRERFDLARTIAERQRNKVALIYLDLDNFKFVNDTLGHVVGDKLLQAVAMRLRDCLRESDILGRQGGDEFLVALCNVQDPDEVVNVLEKIQQQLSNTFVIDGNELSTSLSIGVAVYPDDGDNYDVLLKNADTAMYQSKAAGRNTWHFYTEQMNRHSVEHLHIRNSLRKALERNEFMLFYQPQIDMATGAIIGAEALIRWQHPDLGLIPPNRFIPVAEESGTMLEIGNWVMLEACRQARAWQQDGLGDLVVAVNLSAVQFKQGDLEGNVLRALEASGLAPCWLELELTESILIQNSEINLDRVRALKNLGVKLSIDDFGTGYSSLAYLKRFAVDKLKIDQSFVRDMMDDPNDAVIVRTIIQMAVNLNLQTVAEGVENVEQMRMLRDFHCDQAQGYFFARPMPAAEFPGFVRQHMTY